MRRFLTGCLAALAVSGAWSAEILASFSDAESDLSAAVRLEARTSATVAARVVTGTAPIVSSDGVSSSMWDTTQVANGWHEVADAADAQKRVPPVELLVLNEPDYKVEGGRIEKSMVWSPDKVHWVRNWVVVPNNVVLTVQAGTVVKFGENTGIKVEAGGEVEFAGKDESRVVLTHFADDDFGGDSDFGATNASYGAWSVTAVEGGTIKHIYTKMRYGTMQDTATVSLPASVTAQRIEGKVRIPVTFSGSRTSRFSLHWRATDGTAKFGTDYLLNAGETAWFNAADGKGYFEIPLVTESADTDVKTFLIDLYATEDANPNTSQLRTTVTIVTGTVCPVAVCAESEVSPTSRLEARDETMTGHALVRGMEMKSQTPDAQSEPWDTTKEPEGWNTLTVEDGSTNRSVKVLVRNASDIAFEGGRLSESVVWSNKETHVVRNWVVVPQNTRLLIAAGTVVKFAEHTGIRVEDGGTLQIDGKTDARCVLTALADDTFGGDTDCLETNAVFGTWGITTVGSGVVNDLYTHIRYGAPSTLPTISMPATVTCQRSEGKARIPVTFSGTRTSRFSIHWRAVEESAKKDEDFLLGEGEVAWFSTEGGVGAFEIPINTETEAASNRTFTVEIFSAEDINVDTSRYATKVTIVTGSALPVATCAESEQSNLVRLEARETNTLGRAAVVGTEWKAKDGDSRAEAWDTTPLGYGWQTLEDGRGTNAQVLALNDAKIAVEGGRLTMNATWESNVVHVVRNTVVVPSGVTLSVMTNAVVKFCENTGIKVEAGGSLIVVGSKDEPAIFTPLADDTTGGDTDKRETPVQDGQYAITIISGGTFSDSNAAFRHVVISSHATLSLPAKCEINESEQQVQIPISLSGSRTTPFRAFWRVIDGTAKYPDDFPIRTGVVEWNSSSDGTRYITVPVTDDGIEEDAENFTVELYEAQGANISVSACSCVVTVRDSTAAAVPLATCAESELSAAVRLENRPEGYVGKAVVCGIEQKAAGTNVQSVAWDTTTEPEGWQTLTASDAPEMTAQVLVRNNEKIAVEGGRLTVSTVWDSNTVHLVRNTVVVPSGVTLSVTTNAVVKFCENTGIKVEAGGRFQLLGSLDENVYMTLANDDTVGGDTDKDEEREWVEGAATYSVDVVSGGTFTDMNSVIRGTTIGTFGYASVNAKTVVDAAEGVIRIPVFVNGSRTTQFSVDWKTSDGLRGQLIWGNVNEGTKWVTLNVADCSEKFTFELCECRGINIDGAAKVSEVTVFKNATPLAVCAESESSAAVRFENRADSTFGKALCFGTEWKSADGDSRAEQWDTTQEPNDWIDLGEGMKLLVRNDADLAVEGGRLMPTYDIVNTNGVEVTNWNYSVNWTSDKVHIVRNWVVVPNGMTLTIAAGTVVKFAEFTGFKVEAGGRLYVEGTIDAPVVYTAAADDTIGGDTDKREAEPQYGDYSMNVISGGTYSDRNCAIRYATFSNLGTATLPASAVANEKDGVVRVPMFISTSRTTAFCVDWRVASGTYATKGRLNWNTYSEGTKYIEIPLTPGTIKGEFDTFEIEMYESQGINVSTTERKCVVTIYPDKKFPEEIAFADSDESAAVRLENRDPLWSYGAEIVCGTELKSANGESRAEPWDTTQEGEGWVEVTDGAEKLQLLVRNDESVAVEGGRMEASAVWTKEVVHIVRNWVVVPNGVTLTIAAGTVVKFCDETGIKVEAGGRLNCAGTTAADVILTSINDDTVGGDTDFDDVEPEHGDYWINVISGGTFTDTYTQMRYGESGTFGSVSIPEEVVAKKDGGIVRIPLTISTSRTTPFSVDWIAHDGTAIYGEDYLCASGRIDWTSSSQGTKYLEIPLDRMAPTAEDEWFEVELITGLGINLNLNSTLCLVDLYDSRESLVGGNNGYAESSWATPIEVDGLAGSTYPLFAQPEEIISYSTLWSTNGVDGASVKVTHEDMEGVVCDFLDETGPIEGQTKWKVGDDAYGRYRFRHQVLDADGKQLEIQSQDFIVSDVIEHGGAIRADETWDAGHVHVVRETVTVLRGATLTIEPGAIVKFFPGTGITTQDDGECIANGAQFTHVADDQLGGDTFFDGGITTPGLGEYTLSGNVRTDVGTETRYAKAQVVSANISADTTWGSHTVYHVTKSITIVRPAVLTIQAGAVVKLADGVRITVNSGATLDVQGSRSAQVVFTSIKDDEFGGDSNQDGTATAPKNGIWDEILNSGTLRMSYAHVLYGGYGQYSNQGDAAIRNTGGTATLDCCVVEGSDLRLLGLSGGTMTVRNSVLRDGRWGWEGNVTFVNGVVENCTTGASGGKATNAIFWNCPTAMSGTAQKNCVVFECEGGTGAALIADPKFTDGPAGDYRIGRDSPCVDAGDAESAPESDYYGQTRAGAPDIGLYEVQLRETKVDVDLAAVTVSAAEKAAIGGNLTVTWSVKNVGSMAVADAWRDKLELIDVNGATVVLGTYTVTGGLAADGTRVFTGNFRVPSMSPGAARLRLKVNAERDVFEGSQTDNNVISAENTVQIALPSYTSDDYSKLTLASGTSMALSVAPEDGITALIIRGGAEVAVFGAAGYVPAGLRYDVAATRLADGSLLLSIPSSAAEGDFMFTVENGGASSATVEIETVKDALLISEITPMRASNAGDAYVTIRGVGLDTVASVRLEGSSTYSAQDLQAGSAPELTAQFNLNGASVGTYSVVVEAEDGTTARIGGFEIYKPKTGPKLEARLEIPSTVRQGRIYTGKIVYSNVGDEDMYAPYFAIVARDAELRLIGEDDWQSEELEVMGIADSYPVGIISPGMNCEIAFEFKSGAAPSFRLESDRAGDVEWDAARRALSDMATRVNRRGRRVVRVSELDALLDRESDGEPISAICGVLMNVCGGEALSGVRMLAFTVNGEVIAEDETDENGTFILSGVPNSSNLVVRAVSDVEVDERRLVTPKEGDLLDVFMTGVERSKIVFSVVGCEDVDLIGAAEVTITSDDGVERLTDTTSELNGYVAHVLGGRSYFVKVETLSGYTVETSLICEKGKFEYGAVVDFSTISTVTGVVRDSNGDPVVDACVSLSTEEGQTFYAFTDDFGEYRIGARLNGNCVISADEAGLGHASSKEIKVSTTGTAENVDLVLMRYDNFLELHVEGEIGDRFATVQMKSGETFDAEIVTGGVLRFAGLPSGVADVYFFGKEGYVEYVEADILVNPGVNKIIVRPDFSRVVVAGTAKNSNGEVVPSTWQFSTAYGDGFVVESGQDGLAVCSLRVAMYWVKVSSPGYCDKYVRLQAHENEYVDVVLDRGGYIAFDGIDEPNVTSTAFSSSGTVKLARKTSEGVWIADSFTAGQSVFGMAVGDGFAFYTTLATVDVGKTGFVAKVTSNRKLDVVCEQTDKVDKVVLDHLDGSGFSATFKMANGRVCLSEYPRVAVAVSAYSSQGEKIATATLTDRQEHVTLAIDDVTSVRGKVQGGGYESYSGGRIVFCGEDDERLSAVALAADGSFWAANVSSRYVKLWVELADGTVFGVNKVDAEAAAYVIQIPDDLGEVQVEYLDERGMPLVGYVVTLTTGDGHSVDVKTDSSGRVKTNVPRNSKVKVKPKGSDKSLETEIQPESPQKCYKCGKRPCQCQPEDEKHREKACPKCGHNPCDCKVEKSPPREDEPPPEVKPIPQEELPKLKLGKRTPIIQQQWSLNPLNREWYDYYEAVLQRLEAELNSISKEPDPKFPTCIAKGCTYNKRIWIRYLKMRGLASDALYDAWLELDRIMKLSRVRHGQMIAGGCMIVGGAAAGVAVEGAVIAAGGSELTAAGASFVVSTTASVGVDYIMDLEVDGGTWGGNAVESGAWTYNDLKGMGSSGGGVNRVSLGLNVGVDSAKWLAKDLNFRQEMNGYLAVFHQHLELASAYIGLTQSAASTPYKACKDTDPPRYTIDNDGVSEIRPYTPPSHDPNEMAGPLGVGEKRYVKPGAWMDYTVYFENASDAEAAALDIYVTNPLSEWLDWSTFEMGDVSFNNQIDTNLKGAKNKSSEVPQNGTTYHVSSSVTFDEKKGVVSVELHILDHTTKYGVPEDPYAGILPPNDETHCGEGYFSYRVKVREDAPTGVQIDNSATIIFDYNDPIETDPAWWNTVGQVRKVVVSVDGVEREIEVFEGEAFGELPDPGAGPAHCSFAGWFTGPNGTGTKVTAITLVSAEITTLYPYWLPNVAEVDGKEYVHFYEAVAQCPYDADEFSEITLLSDFEANDGISFEYPELSDDEVAEIEEYGHWTSETFVGYRHWQYLFESGEDRIFGVSYRKEDWSFFTGQKVVVDLNGHCSSNAWIQVDCADVVIRDSSLEKTGVVSGDFASSLVDSGSLTLESGRLFLGNGGGGDAFGLNIKNQGNDEGGFFNFLGGEVVAKDGLAAVSVGSNCVVSIGGTAVATNAAGNVVLAAGSELNLASDFTGRVGITTDNDVEGAAIGLNPSGFTGAENLYCDSDPSLRGLTTDDGLIVWERVGPFGGVASFVETDLAADENGTVTVRVDGGNPDRSSSVKVYLKYTGASSSDIDVNKTVVDGKAAKKVTFPVTLKWAAGEVCEKTIVLKLKKDSLAEGPESLTLQLGGELGMTLGEARTCTVTIRDTSVNPLKGLVKNPAKLKGVKKYDVTVASADEAAGLVSPGGSWYKGAKLTVKAKAKTGYVFSAWYDKTTGRKLSTSANYTFTVSKAMTLEARFSKRYYVRALADPADGATVSGSGWYAKNKTATLKAKAKSHFKFLGWYAAKADDPNAPDMTKKLSGSTTFKPKVTGDLGVFACYKSDPRLEIFKTSGGSVSGASKYAKGKTATLKAKVSKGYAFLGWYDAEGNRVSQATSYKYKMGAENVVFTAQFKKESALAAPVLDWNAATEFPVGVSYSAKPKVSCEAAVKIVKVTGLPAGLSYKSGKVSGAPTAVKTYTVSVTVALATNAKKTWTLKQKLVVTALPAWAKGTFNGGSETTPMQATLTVGSTGKVSGKLCFANAVWTLSGTHYTKLDGLSATLSLTAKKGTTKKTVAVTVYEGQFGGFAFSETKGFAFEAQQNLWKSDDFMAGYLKDWAAQMPGKEYSDLADGLTVKFGQDGTVTAKLKVGKNTFSATTVFSLTAIGEATVSGRLYLYFAPNATKKFRGTVRIVEVGFVP